MLLNPSSSPVETLSIDQSSSFVLSHQQPPETLNEAQPSLEFLPFLRQALAQLDADPGVESAQKSTFLAYRLSFGHHLMQSHHPVATDIRARLQAIRHSGYLQGMNDSCMRVELQTMISILFNRHLIPVRLLSVLW
jgi:hypothetical protein